MALSVHMQLELLSRSQTWVKSKLKSFQILGERLLEPVEGASWVGFVLISLQPCQTGSIDHRAVFFIRVLSATLTQDW